MKYLILFILIFLLIRIAADAYMRRRERLGTQARNPFTDRQNAGFGQQAPRKSETRRHVGNVEDAQFEVIEEQDEQKKSS
ncbi:hypothetical protein CYPRO_0005 [Cyclonatronum proteinivorum]|uniref:DUF4834 family protein n=1 Tax=Cyclonatronum proteinivorum TaxID=1457365 RepID=A0A345UFP4_9BACT|nr:hypothetical protein [Cyclonatronum proteinivorum]AXI99295.1 hypothetical protein CYPRO_0005 [Cyclonatronum proteinivorum]